MSDSRGWLRAFANGCGLLSVVAAVGLSTPGVQVVRAEGPEDPGSLMSVDPALAQDRATPPAAPAPIPPAAPAPIPPAAPAPIPPAIPSGEPEPAGVPSVEVAPGIVVLNTRGYNYGPPPGEVDPEAAKLEDRTD